MKRLAVLLAAIALTLGMSIPAQGQTDTTWRGTKWCGFYYVATVHYKFYGSTIQENITRTGWWETRYKTFGQHTGKWSGSPFAQEYHWALYVDVNRGEYLEDVHVTCDPLT